MDLLVQKYLKKIYENSKAKKRKNEYLHPIFIFGLGFLLFILK